MPYFPVRKDFAFDAHCHANCGHRLRSNVATILSDEHGNEFPFGPTCARNHLDEAGVEELRRIPDFTKAAPGQEREGGPHPPGTRNGAAPRDEDTAKLKRVVTYLLLRQDRLAHIPGATYQALAPYHAIYMAEKSLPDDAISHISNIAKKSAGGKYGFDNLQAVYAFDQCIGRALLGITEERQKFLLDVRKYLRDNLYITQAQVSGIDNWLRRIDGYIPLDSSGFWKG